MRPLRYVRRLEPEERPALEAGRHSDDAFVLRRSQIVLASAAGEPVPAIAKRVGRSERSVHAVLDAFEARGLACLRRRSSRPHTVRAAFPAAQAEALRGLLHQSPRTFDKPTSLWTLELAADVSFAQGVTPSRGRSHPSRASLARLGVSWQRAKRWITSPDPEYARKKDAATA